MGGGQEISSAVDLEMVVGLRLPQKTLELSETLK